MLLSKRDAHMHDHVDVCQFPLMVLFVFPTQRHLMAGMAEPETQDNTVGNLEGEILLCPKAGLTFRFKMSVFDLLESINFVLVMDFHACQ